MRTEVSTAWKRALAGALMMLFTACAGSQKNALIHDRTSAFVYSRPMEEVWTQARQMLHGMGFSMRESKPERGPWLMVSEWKGEAGGGNVSTVYTRYLVEGRKLGEARAQIRVTQFTRSPNASGAGTGAGENNTHQGIMKLDAGKSQALEDSGTGVPTFNTGGSNALHAEARPMAAKRDLDFEWNLLRKLQPAQAQEIEAAAIQLEP